MSVNSTVVSTRSNIASSHVNRPDEASRTPGRRRVAPEGSSSPRWGLDVPYPGDPRSELSGAAPSSRRSASPRESITSVGAWTVRTHRTHVDLTFGVEDGLIAGGLTHRRVHRFPPGDLVIVAPPGRCICSGGSAARNCLGAPPSLRGNPGTRHAGHPSIRPRREFVRGAQWSVPKRRTRTRAVDPVGEHAAKKRHERSPRLVPDNTARSDPAASITVRMSSIPFSTAITSGDVATQDTPNPRRVRPPTSPRRDGRREGYGGHPHGDGRGQIGAGGAARLRGGRSGHAAVRSFRSGPRRSAWWRRSVFYWKVNSRGERTTEEDAEFRRRWVGHRGVLALEHGADDRPDAGR